MTPKLKNWEWLKNLEYATLNTKFKLQEMSYFYESADMQQIQTSN